MKEVPTLTIGKEPKTEQDVVLEKLRLENEELKARLAACDEELRRARRANEDRERAYMRGRIDGLEFSIRCNGICGDEVGK